MMSLKKKRQLGVRIPHEIIMRLDKYVMREWRAGNPEIVNVYRSRAHLVASVLIDWLNEKEKKGTFKHGESKTSM